MQNAADVQFTPTDLAAVDDALVVLRRVLGRFTALEPMERRVLNKMGGKSEAFCRQTVTVLAGNPQIVPPSIVVADAQAKLATFDALRPRLQQLRQLLERGDDAALLLGSDVMNCALAGYGLLKVAGKGEALNATRRELAVRFAKTRRTIAAPAQEA